MTIESRVKAALDSRPDDKKLRLLASGFQDAWKACVAERTAANLKALETWETKLGAYLDALPAPQEQSSEWRWCEEAKAWPDPLPNRNRAFEYMLAMGWDVKRSSWYKEPGKTCPPASVGGWMQVSVNEYARIYGVPKPGTPASRWEPSAVKKTKAERMGVVDPAAQIFSLTEQLKQARKEGVDLDNAMKAIKLEFEQGKYVSAETLHEKQFALAVVMYERIKEDLVAVVPTVIRTAAGDPGFRAAVTQTVTDSLDRSMREVSKQELFQKLFEGMRS